MSDPINVAIEDVNAQSTGETKVKLNGQDYNVQEAIDELRKIVSQNVEPFDNTKPRLIEPISINVGGKVRHLRLPFWALRRFQRETGVSPWDFERVWTVPADLDMTVALLWAALLDESPELTLDEVWMFEGLDFANIHYIRKCLDDCWGRNMPDPEASTGGSEPDPNRSKRRTG